MKNSRNHKKHSSRHNKHQKNVKGTNSFSRFTNLLYLRRKRKKHRKTETRPSLPKSICRYETCKLQHNSLIKFKSIKSNHAYGSFSANFVENSAYL